MSRAPAGTLNYTLEGADAASFGINAANGQLLTLAGVTLDRSTYTVTVVASDGTASARITVTINVVLNNPPVFTEGASTTRSVSEDAAAGVNIGSPVAATDTDQGDTLTYALGGADAARSHRSRQRPDTDQCHPGLRHEGQLHRRGYGHRHGPRQRLHYGDHQRHPGGGGGL